MSAYFKIGKIIAAHGLDGEVILQHSLGKKTSLKGIEAIFIEDRKDSFLPYFVLLTKIKNDEEIYLRLEEINTRETALKLIRKEIWMKEEDFKQYASTSASISLLGFQMIDKGVNLGKIEEIIDQPHQILCKIWQGANEILIPLHEQTLEKIDRKNRTVYVNLPDGLLDIYRNR